MTSPDEVLESARKAIATPQDQRWNWDVIVAQLVAIYDAQKAEVEHLRDRHRSMQAHVDGYSDRIGHYDAEATQLRQRAVDAGTEVVRLKARAARLAAIIASYRQRAQEGLESALAVAWRRGYRFHYHQERGDHGREDLIPHLEATDLTQWSPYETPATGQEE